MARKLKKSVRLYNIMFYLLLLLTLVLSIIYFAAAQNIFGIVVVLAILVIALVAIIGIRGFSRTVDDKVLNDSVEVANREMQYMQHWDFPYALAKPDGRIFWVNDAFRNLFTEELASFPMEESRLDSLFGKLDYPEEGGSRESEIIVKGRIYRLVLSQEPVLESGTGELSELLYAASLLDITREKALQTENVNIRPVVALIYIDNYEQSLGTMEEIRRPMLEAMVYRRITDLSTSVNGVLTRMEKDRLLLVFPYGNLGTIQETKFKILEDIRKISIGNTIPVTLSIGVGIADGLEQSNAYARAAMDLAMSRGGDQAVVKTKDNTLFYGGRSGGVEKTTRVRARLIAQALHGVIMEAENVLIMGHANPDLDCFGAAIGLAGSVERLGKTVHIVMSEPHPAIDSLYTRAIEDEQYQDCVITPLQADQLINEKTLLVVVDVNRPTITAAPRLLETVSNVVVIDHHRAATDAIRGAVISYVEPYASSCCEMITEIIQYLTDNVHLRPIEADAMFAGIALDTKNFTVKTGIRTFEAAAYLRRNGADSLRVREMFKNDITEYRYRAQIVSQAEIYRDRIAISYWDGRKVTNALALAAGAADELLDIRGVDASFVLTDIGEMINVSARSLGDINVQVVMEKIGGGGHLTVAGAQLRDSDMQHALTLLRKTIQDYLETNR